MISIGNEINDGFLWPVGKISVNGYDGLSQLLHSAAQGVRAASGSVRIMVHLANGWNNSVVSGFWKNVIRQGQFATSDYDIMGYSMYPFYESQATIGNLRTAMTNIVNSQGKVSTIVCGRAREPATDKLSLRTTPFLRLGSSPGSRPSGTLLQAFLMVVESVCATGSLPGLGTLVLARSVM